jgi:hypothetical protein
MILDLRNGYFLATGNLTRDAELKYVGEKKTPLTAFSFAAGKREDGSTIFVDAKAWRELARYASLAAKGDAVCAIGPVEKREYNGKTYSTLVCEWMNIAIPSASDVGAPLPGVSSGNAFSDYSDADGDLPF